MTGSSLPEPYYSSASCLIFFSFVVIALPSLSLSIVTESLATPIVLRRCFTSLRFCLHCLSCSSSGGTSFNSQGNFLEDHLPVIATFIKLDNPNPTTEIKERHWLGKGKGDIRRMVVGLPRVPEEMTEESENLDPSLQKIGEPIRDINLSPTVQQKPITARRRHRLTSLENTELTEVLTIYEKLKKGRENRVFRHSRFDATARIDIEFNEADETVPIVPIFNGPAENNTKTLLDFTKYQNLEPKKYFYFSEKTNLLQADVLEEFPNYSRLLSGKNFWFNIFNPNEQDFAILFNSYGVHDLTLNDIREGNTEDKVEAFKHYTFFSLRLMTENIKDRKENEDIDFNILLFKDFIITMHDKQWAGNTDILGFLNLLITHSRTPLTPDWVMFSCFVEMNQDAKFAIQLIEPQINRIRIETKEMEMSHIMRRIFELELQVYSIGRFVKPKARVLRHLKVKCNKRINRIVMNLLNDINDEFREQTQDLTHFNHILERSQDTFLAIVSADQSREANEMSLVMKRISECALVFLPIQAISGFMGMNVTVPFQHGLWETQIPFWVIVTICVVLGATSYLNRDKILAARSFDELRQKERLRLGPSVCDPDPCDLEIKLHK